MVISTKYLGDGERVVVSTRTHPKALLVPVLILVLALVVGVAATALLDGGAIVALIVWILVAVVVVWWTVRPVISWLTTTYTFTDRRFIKRSGFVSKEGRTIPLNRISGVDFEIGVIDRLFGCGTLVVSDASTDGRVELPDIPRVEQVQLLVSEELNHFGPGATRSDRHDDGT